jgi:hypothetical protein
VQRFLDIDWKLVFIALVTCYVVPWFILISDQPQQAHSVSQWDKKMGAFHQEMRHANEPSPVPEGPVDAGVP